MAHAVFKKLRTLPQWHPGGPQLGGPALKRLCPRSKFSWRLDLERNRGLRTGGPASLVCFSLARLPSNDQKAIVAAALRESRAEDEVVRNAPTKLTILLPDTSAEGATVFAKRVASFIPAQPSFEVYSATEFAEMSPVPFWKKLFDRVVAIGLLLFLSPLMLAIAVLVRLTSPGPALYRQTRVGLHGEPFVMYKFRTMRRDSSAIHEAHVRELIREGAQLRKVDASLPITGPGHLLRQTGLDELPQLFNVLKGEMSLVGPRPFLTYETDSLTEWQKRRYTALPGITGLWQINNRDAQTFQEMLKLDLLYVQRGCLSLDWFILTRTPAALLRGLRNSEANPAEGADSGEP